MNNMLGLVILLVVAILIVIGEQRYRRWREENPEDEQFPSSSSFQQTDNNTISVNDNYCTRIAGINFRNGINDLVGHEVKCSLEADPRNEYDPFAIKVIHTQSGHHLGFVPAKETEAVRKFIHYKLPFFACKAQINLIKDDKTDPQEPEAFFAAELKIYNHYV
jgi:hypothetical protein